MRSFPPVEPLGLRWDYPLWRPDTDIDVRALRGRRGPEQQLARDEEATSIILRELLVGPKTARSLRGPTRMSGERIERVLAILTGAGEISHRPSTRSGRPCEEYFRLYAPTAPRPTRGSPPNTVATTSGTPDPAANG